MSNHDVVVFKITRRMSRTIKVSKLSSVIELVCLYLLNFACSLYPIIGGSFDVYCCQLQKAVSSKVVSIWSLSTWTMT